MYFLYPLPKHYPITQIFGVRYWYKGKFLKHMGADFGCPKGTSILASGDGRVSRVINSGVGYGKHLYLDHTHIWQTMYAHLSVFSVSLGDEVRRGDVIGFSGRTGFWRGRTGYHLHYGIKRNGIWVDPLPLILGSDMDNIEYVKNLYRGILLRDPDKREIKEWCGHIDSGKLKSHDVARRLVLSDEFRKLLRVI